MANRIFSTQRSVNGDAFFISQVEGATRDISISLVANPSLAATAQKFSLLQIKFNSNPNLNVSLRLVPATMRANLSSTSSLAANLQLIESRMGVELHAEPSIVAKLDYQVVIPLNMAAELVANPSLSATLMLLGGSNIPRKVKLRAVPVDSETEQLTRFRGDTYSDAFQVFDDKTGEPVDITGCTFKLGLATVKNPEDNSDIIYTLLGKVEDPRSGVVYFAPSVEQADRVGFFYYDMELRDGKGLIKTLVSSSYVYQQDITK